MNEKYIKIVTFQSDNGVSYGTDFSATKAENVALYNDSVIESGNTITDFPKQIWIGNIGINGKVFEHDKNPFVDKFMLSCREDGRPYRFLKRLDIDIENTEWSQNAKNIKVVCFTSIDIYDTTNSDVYILDTYDGIIHGRKATDLEDTYMINYSKCGFISENVLMFKEYCDLTEWDNQYDDKEDDDLCYHYCLYNTKTREKAGFLANDKAIELNKEKRDETIPIVFDMLHVGRKDGTYRIDGVKLRLDTLTLQSEDGEDLTEELEG